MIIDEGLQVDIILLSQGKNIGKNWFTEPVKCIYVIKNNKKPVNHFISLFLFLINAGLPSIIFKDMLKIRIDLFISSEMLLW